MSDVNWDLAPNDAETLEQNVNIITWRKKGYFWLGMDGWKEEFFPTKWSVVATRPKTKTIADSSQASCSEGEKWTHTYNDGDIKCCIKLSKLDFNGCVVVFNDFEEYQLIQPRDLKPIKPKLTEDAKRQLELYVQYRVDKYGDYPMKSDLADYLSKHEII